MANKEFKDEHLKILFYKQAEFFIIKAIGVTRKGAAWKNRIIEAIPATLKLCETKF